MNNFDTFLSQLGATESGGVLSPLDLSTTFHRNADGSYNDELVYIRNDNPNRRQLEQALAFLEGGTDAFAFASAQAATLAILHLLPAQSHVIIPDDGYFGVGALLSEVFPESLLFSKVDMTDLKQVEMAIKPQTRMIWVETPSNPQLKITDLGEIGKICARHKILFVVDNTLSTPLLQQPFRYGADLILHSLTKYLNGHSDVLGGMVVLREKTDLQERMKMLQKIGGGVLSPFSAWMTLRGMRTLALRLRKHCENASLLANYLSTHPQIERVLYPGLSGHLEHEIAKKQMTDFGGLLSICVKGGAEAAMKVQAQTKCFVRATSLGGTESLIEHRASVEIGTQTPQNLLRLSVGLEDVQDLIDDLRQALQQLDA